MDAPDELRQAIRDAIYRAPIGSAADAVLGMPGIADALARDAQMRGLVHDVYRCRKTVMRAWGEIEATYMDVLYNDDGEPKHPDAVAALYTEAGK